MDIRLIVQSGDSRTGHQFPIDVTEFIIGRDPKCHLQIDHNLVDSRHCRLRLSSGRVAVEDLNSANGTFLNDQPIKSTEARRGDRLKIGPTTFLVMIESDPKDLDRRVADWCVNTLEARSGQGSVSERMESAAAAMTADLAGRILTKLSNREGVVEGRKRLRVGESRGINVVKFVDNAIVQDADICEIERELIDLVDSGSRRLLLNFDNVENLSTQVVGALVKVHRLCEDHGGALKVCKLKPKVMSIFSMTGLAQQFEIFREERPALESLWPELTAAEKAARDAAKVLPPEPEAAESELVLPTAPSTASTTERVDAPMLVQLIVASGSSEGKAIDIRSKRFLIGRDSCCQLRPSSSAISQMHAVIERRGNRTFLRDLGSKNGTVLNDRVLEGEEAEVADGDRLRLGSLLFRFRLAPAAIPKPDAIVSRSGVDLPAQNWMDETLGTKPADELAASWLLGSAEGLDSPGSTTLLQSMPVAKPVPPPVKKVEPPPPAQAPAAKAETSRLMCLRHEVVQDVLVVSILTPDLNDEGTVAPIRAELLDLFDQPLPRRMVLSLEAVTYLSSRAVGIILAHYQRLARGGGDLRICHVRPVVMMVLEQMRLTKVMDVYPTIEEAVLAAWE